MHSLYREACTFRLILLNELKVKLLVTQQPLKEEAKTVIKWNKSKSKHDRINNNKMQHLTSVV